MLRTVERGPQDLGHARVQLEEFPRAGGDHILHAAEDGAGVGDEERAGLDFEAQGAPMHGGELFERLLHGCADDLRVGALLGRDAGDLVAATQVERDDFGEARHQRQTGGGDFLPHDGIAARADVGVDADDLELMLRSDGLGLVGPLVPDAERGIGSTDVRLARPAGTPTRVETETHLVARQLLADPLQLEERTRVHMDP